MKQGREESQYQCSDGPVMGRLLLQATGAQSRGGTSEDYGDPVLVFIPCLSSPID